ncbi:MAG: response regulator transcription factor [Burkholderiales bacterium]|nr:response regulator transcription factor [Opitutaceae bacterium]
MVILVVEDERALSRHVVAALRREGHDVRASHDGEQAVRDALAETHDLIVLDLNLPSLDGLGVLARLRAAGCPSRVLILTSRHEVEDRVAGLRAGADDYLAKPFAVEELVARVHALGRRAGALAISTLLTVGDLHADVENRRVTRGGVPILLTPREFELLHLFLREPGRVFSRGEICERIWKRDHRYETKTVEVFVARLRRKLDPDERAPLLHTVRAFGYVLQAHAPDVHDGHGTFKA